MSVPFRSILLLLPLATIGATGPERLGFDPTTSNGIASAASIYFAPENALLFRMRSPDGAYREFQGSLDPKDPSLWSVRGWHGEIRGNLVLVETGRNVEGGIAHYIFDRGRLVMFMQGGKKYEFPYALERSPTDGGPPYAFDAPAKPSGKRSAKGGATRKKGLSSEVNRELSKKWAKSGRLQWPFPNPNDNGFLYLAIALLSTGFFFARPRVAKVIGAVIFVAASGALVMTASRGAFLAFAAGLAPAIFLNFRTLSRSKAFWTLACVVLLVAVGWFATHESRLLTRGFSKASKWSNDIRLEMWATAPTMVAEAPDGWGDMHVGRAYMDWYGGLTSVSLSASLVNDHLTRIVGYSRMGRFWYIFVWLASLSLMVYTALRSRRTVALGLAIALLVCGWFNAVMMNSVIRFTPWLILVAFIAERPWRHWRLKPACLVVLAAAVLSAVVLFAIYQIGSGRAKRGYPIRVVDGQIRVKSAEPSIWVVDDGVALGGVFSCRDIRRFYVYNKAAPGVGYVRDIADLPGKGVRRLVLAGSACDEWMRHVSEGGADARRNLPEEVIFISPPFPPSALPEGLFASCKVRLVVGEFVARYEAEYAVKRDWVTIVPAMELYIYGWMRYVVGD